jgi:predicted small integral membrane protein
MILRAAKTSLVSAVALYFSLFTFNNIVDYDSNYQFVRHILMMDTTFSGNRLMWRALNLPAWHTAFYWSIIAWESVATVLCWWGTFRLAKAIRKNTRDFCEAKNVAIGGLTAGLLLFLVAFLVVGGEWFLMWQSPTWNGQQAAYRMFAILGIVLLFLTQPEPLEQL